MIYVISTPDNQFCKIGYAVDPIKRLATFQTGFPYTLKLVAVFRGERSDEAEWHADYAVQRERGEWFRVTRTMMRELFFVTSNEVYDLDPVPYAKLDRRTMPLAPPFWQVARRAPGLWDLAAEACAEVDDDHSRSFCGNRIWYDFYKPRLLQLVGFEAKRAPAEVKTSQAYSAAYQAIYHCLPDCRGCICV